MGYGFVGSTGGAVFALTVRESAVEEYGPEGRGALDPDAVQDLADRIATLAALLHAGKYRLLALLAEFDAVRGWELGGHRSCAHWVHFHLGYAMGTAREHVRVARALESLRRRAR